MIGQIQLPLKFSVSMLIGHEAQLLIIVALFLLLKSVLMSSRHLFLLAVLGCF